MNRPDGDGNGNGDHGGDGHVGFNHNGDCEAAVTFTAAQLDSSRPSFSWPTRPGPASAKYARIEREASRKWNTPGGRATHNPEVLMNIARNMCTKNLKSLRETSKLWNREFVPHFKEKHAPVELSGQYAWVNDEVSMMLRVNELVRLKYSSPSGLLPFTRYRLFVMGPQQPASFIRLVLECGSSMQRVKLTWHTFEELPMAQLRHFVFEAAPQLEELILECDPHPADKEHQPYQQIVSARSLVKVIPNLKRVSVSSVCCDPAHGSYYTRFITEIMHSASNLDSLKVKATLGRPGSDEPINFNLRLLRDLHDSVPDLGKLQTLKLHAVSTSGLQILVQLGQRQQAANALRLQKCSLSIECELERDPNSSDDGVGLVEEVIPLLHSFLVTQAPTLRNLAIKFRVSGVAVSSPPPKILLQIPLMPQLRVFKTGRDGWSSDVSYEGGSFEAAFPCLKRVSYTDNNDDANADENGNRAAAAQMHHRGVIELVLMLKRTNEEHLAAFPVLFPGLTKLEISRINSSGCPVHFEGPSKFEKLWTNWPALCQLNGERRDNDRTGAAWLWTPHSPLCNLPLNFKLRRLCL